MHIWQFLFLTISLRCLQDSLSDPRVKSLLHLYIAERNFSLKKGGYLNWGLLGISLESELLICQCCAELNNSWRACQRSLISMYSLPLYLIASIAGSFLFLTQFISSYGPFFLFKISCILLSKNSCLETLTAFLKNF